MNSADSDQLKNAIRSQGQRLGQQEEQMAAIQHGVQHLSNSHGELQSSVTTQVNLLAAEVQRVLTHLQAASPPTTPPVPAATGSDPNRSTEPHSTSIRLAPPEKYSGDSEGCRTFIVQCELHYHHQPAAFPTDNSKVAFMISHLSGRAAAWATAEWSRGSPICGSLENFIDTMRKIFNQTTPGREAARALIKLKQHQRSVADYAIEFRTMAADSGWNSAALFDAFVSGLSDSLQDQLAPLDLPTDLDSVISMAIRIDNRLTERRRNKSKDAVDPPPQRRRSPLDTTSSWRPRHPSPAFRTTAPPGSVEEPMQLGRAKLSMAERQRRLKEGLCFYCGQRGHPQAACPVKEEAHQ